MEFVFDKSFLYSESGTAFDMNPLYDKIYSFRPNCEDSNSIQRVNKHDNRSIVESNLSTIIFNRWHSLCV